MKTVAPTFSNAFRSNEIANPGSATPSTSATTANIDTTFSDVSEIADARNKIGIFPVSLRHISHQYHKRNEEVPNDDSEVIYKGDKYHQAKIAAAHDFLNIELNLKNINITEARMSFNPDSGILWITTDQYSVRKMFSSKHP